MKKIDLDVVVFGPEPECSTHTIHRALYWYGNKKTLEDSKAYTITYAKENHFSNEIIKKLSLVSENSFKNLGFVCRMVSRGFNLNKETWIKSKINDLILNDVDKKEVDANVVETKPNVQDRIFNQATAYINEIEEKIDNIIQFRNFDFKCYDWLATNAIKAIYMTQIIEHFAPLLKELTLAYSKQDDQLIEAYSHWSKSDLSKYLSFVTNIISDCDKFGKNIKTVRKVQKRKVISADKKVAKLQFKKEDIENKIVSINPIEIIAAQQLWVFNIKYRKLGVYYANDESGFSVKGTTLENFNDVFSISKTLRKPLEILPSVINGKKPDLKKIMKEIKSTEYPLTGRINNETILLRVIK